MNFKLNQDIHCWYYKVNPTPNNLDYYEGLIDLEEREMCNRFKFRKDKEVHITARAILRILTGHYLNMDPKEIKFAYNEFNKPRYAEVNSLKFNISYSGNMIVFGFVQNFEIGVDIEKTKTDIDVMNIARNFFSQKEVKALKSVSPKDRYRAFFRCWTRKEAFIKAEGSGLSFPLKTFAVSLDSDEDAKLLETKWDLSEKHQWKIFSFVPSNDYIAAVAIKGAVDMIKYKNLNDYEISGFQFIS